MFTSAAALIAAAVAVALGSVALAVFADHVSTVMAPAPVSVAVSRKAIRPDRLRLVLLLVASTDVNVPSSVSSTYHRFVVPLLPFLGAASVFEAGQR